MEKLLVLDYESHFDWGLEIWHPEFRLISADFLYINGERTATKFTSDLSLMKQYIQFCMDNGYKILVYNASYEFAVTLKMFGIDISSSMIDVMRLHYIVTKSNVLSLSGAVEEYFNIPDYKDKYHQYLINNGIAKNKKEAKGKVGELPLDLLAEYNRADTEYTLKVYYHCVAELAKIGFNWHNDMFLYTRDVRRNCISWLKGIQFNREEAAVNLQKLKEEHQATLNTFFENYKEELIQTELLMAQAFIESDYLARKTKAKNPEKIQKKELNEDIIKKFKFNLNSTSHLAVLFVDILHITPKILTKGGAPSFSIDFISQWGDGGKILGKAASYKKPINELTSLLEHSSVDGRVHLFIRPGGTITGRGSSSKEV